MKISCVYLSDPQEDRDGLRATQPQIVEQLPEPSNRATQRCAQLRWRGWIQSVGNINYATHGEKREEEEEEKEDEQDQEVYCGTVL